MSHLSDQRLRAWIQRFAGRATSEDDAAVGASLDERVQDSIVLVNHGEPVVALENACQNLYEWGVSLSRQELDELVELLRAYGMSQERYAFMDELAS